MRTGLDEIGEGPVSEHQSPSDDLGEQVGRRPGEVGTVALTSVEYTQQYQ